MTTQSKRLNAGTRRFTVLGREYEIEGAFVADRNAISVGLYENGRMIYSMSEPVLDKMVAGEVESAMSNSLGSLEAQIKEMFAYLEEVENGASSQLALLLASIFESRGIYDEADRMYVMAVNLNETNSEALYLHGVCLTAMGDYGKAVERLGEAVSQKPLYADYRNAYGLALAWIGKISESRKQLDHALELNTYYVDAYYSAGLVCLFNGVKNIDKEYAQEFVPRAQKLFAKATLIDSTYLTDEYKLASETLAAGSVREAFSYFKNNRDTIASKSRSSYEECRTRFLATLQSSGKQAIDAQIGLLRRQLVDNPEYVDVSFQLALAYFQSSICEWKAGIDQLKSVLELNPELYKAVRAHDISYELLESMEQAMPKMESGSDA